MYPTVAEILELPEVQRGHPRIAAGKDGVDRAVRWVHALELRDVTGLVRGGELLLTTGVALPENAGDLRRYIQSLASNGVVGVGIELGFRWTTLPQAMVDEADRRGVVLVAFHSGVPFISITEAVHSVILSSQLALLKTSEQIHEAFTRLGTEGATTQEIVDEAARWAGAPVVLESPAHRVLAASHAGHHRDVVLGDWERRSRHAHAVDHTGRYGPEGWLVAPVRARSQAWGRLILQPGETCTSNQRMALERAAAALALGRLIEPDAPTLERQAHRCLLADIVAGHHDDKDLYSRAAALGVPMAGHALLGLVVDPRGPASDAVDQSHGDALVAAAIDQVSAAAIAGPLERGIGVVLAVPGTGPHRETVRQLADAVHRRFTSTGRRVVVGAGAVASTMAQAAASLREAAVVARAAPCRAAGESYLTLADVRLAGLLTMLRSDPRLEAFIERELGALLADTSRDGTELLRTLHAYLTAGRNRALTARSLHLSRQALYRRLDRLQQLLKVDLDDAESCLSLHVALTAVRHAGVDRRVFDW
ncbi:PucR family transcriptional regulator [Jiangella mangrovi]|uniref:Purine catabolism regulator n=1 Tax=Jiangella mangrovi TaxID=1524084 RepID=A0A7W9GRR6_9ACTN|nr:PucR family transcriptional regulator [Jiangella mangrovi]MBB5788838.1 purine catabolism regulator [Jiangella mangrovi]